MKCVDVKIGAVLPCVVMVTGGYVFSVLRLSFRDIFALQSTCFRKDQKLKKEDTFSKR